MPTMQPKDETLYGGTGVLDHICEEKLKVLMYPMQKDRFILPSIPICCGGVFFLLYECF
jgi:hypothetical protein